MTAIKGQLDPHGLAGDRRLGGTCNEPTDRLGSADLPCGIAGGFSHCEGLASIHDVDFAVDVGGGRQVRQIVTHGQAEIQLACGRGVNFSIQALFRENRL
ncbi:hypothetical protein D3C81_1478650 [compost metagenome]